MHFWKASPTIDRNHSLDLEDVMAKAAYKNLKKQYHDVISLEQLRKICRIAKRTAKYLLDNGIIPCTNTGKKTHCSMLVLLSGNAVPVVNAAAIANTAVVLPSPGSPCMTVIFPNGIYGYHYVIGYQMQSQRAKLKAGTISRP